MLGSVDDLAGYGVGQLADLVLRQQHDVVADLGGGSRHRPQRAGQAGDALTGGMPGQNRLGQLEPAGEGVQDRRP